MTSDSTERLSLRTRLTRPVFLAYVLVLFALAQQAWFQPLWEWDLLGYTGAVEEMRGASPEDVHAAVYSELARVAPEDVAEELRSKIEYRSELTRDAGAFNAQLRFYRGRVVFLGLLLGLDSMGLPPMRAAFLISALAGIAFGVLLALWLMGYLPPSLAVLVAILAVSFGGAREVMSMATPDMLAATLLLAGAFCLVETKRRVLAIALLLLALATRADHILLVGPLLVWFALRPAGATPGLTRGQLAGALSLCLAVFLACTAGRDTYSWWTVFHHTFVEYKAFPATQTPPADYAMAISRTLQSLPMFKATLPLLFSLIAVVASVWGWRAKRFTSLGAGLGAVSLAAALAHFALFPALWPRLMLAYWTLGLVALCISWCERAASEPSEELA